MFRGNFAVAWMPATLCVLLASFAAPSGASEYGDHPTDRMSASMGISLVIPPRVEIGNGGSVALGAGHGDRGKDRKLCVSANSGAFTVMAIGRNSDTAFALEPGTHAPGYRVSLGGQAMNPGQRISLPPQVPGASGCARGAGAELQVSLPRESASVAREKGPSTDVLTLVFAAN